MGCRRRALNALSVAMFSIALLGGRAATKPSPATAKAVTLPIAHAGQEYSAILAVVSSIPYGRAQCAFDHAPAWLVFDQSNFTFGGKPSEKESVVYEFHLTMSDGDAKSAKQQVVTLMLPVVAGPEVVYADPKQAPKPPKPETPAGKGLILGAGGTQMATPSGSGPSAAFTGGTPAGLVISYEPRLLLTSEILEGTGVITGIVKDIPPAVIAPAIEVWIKPERQQEYRAQLTASDKEGNPGQQSQATVDAATGNFKATLATPPAAGETVIVRVVSPEGSGLLLGHDADRLEYKKTLVKEIPYPEIVLSQALTSGLQAISGYVKNLPHPPIAATTGDPTHGTTATPGNLPLLAADIEDQANGNYRAQLQTSATNSTPTAAIQVNTDGSFTLRLVKALAPGQRVTVVPIAPQGHFFDHQATQAISWTVPKLEQPVTEPQEVFSTLALTEPVITSKLTDDVTTISGIATPSLPSGTTINVAVRRVMPHSERALPVGGGFHDQHVDGPCPTMDELEEHAVGEGYSDYELLTSSSGTAKSVATGTNGSFSLTLATPAMAGEKLQIVQVLPAGTYLFDAEKRRCFSAVYEVVDTTGWGRVRAYFTAGLLLSNNSTITSSNSTGTQDSGNFSQAHEFLDLSLERSWLLPGCYVRTLADPYPPSTSQDDKDGKPDAQPRETCFDAATGIKTLATRQQHWQPGISTIFETRLTAIPVSTLTATTPVTLSTNQLTSAQTARLGAGVYLPFLLTRWDYHQEPNAFFVAPLAKVGFDTVTGPSNQSVILSSGVPGTIALENIYNFWEYGARIGHYAMTQSTRVAPYTDNYLDIAYGPYSNLQSYICHRTPSIATTTTTGGVTTTTYGPVPGYQPPTNNTGSSCLTDYPSFYDATLSPLPPGISSAAVWGPLDSRKRLYRLDIEGLLRIPYTPLYVGFNANVGQKTLGAGHLDNGYAAPDDLRFLFGTKFDIGTALSKMGISPF